MKSLSLVPVESSAHELKELPVRFVEEAVEFLEDGGLDPWVSPALGVMQAALPPVVAEAVEALGLVEVEVGGVDLGCEVKEPLHHFHLGQGVPDELVAVHQVDVLQWEEAEPVLHVLVVQAAAQGLVLQVHLAVLHQDCFDGLIMLVLLQPVVEDLGVVRQHPLRGISQDEQELDVGVHPVDPLRDLAGGEVGGGLLHDQLLRLGEGHLAEVPGQPFLKVALPVEEVHLVLGRRHLAVQAQHFNQGPGAALPHADDDGPGELPDGPVRTGGGGNRRDDGGRTWGGRGPRAAALVIDVAPATVGRSGRDGRGLSYEKEQPKKQSRH